jgi:tetratricopeptide (TPR) repeat protein
LMAMDPDNVDLRHLHAFTDLDSADVLLAMGRLDSASQRAQTALDAFRALVEADPKVAEYPFDVGLALSTLADVAERRGEPGRAVTLLHTALQGASAIEDSGPTDANLRFATAREEALYGKAYALLAADVHRSREQRKKDWKDARDAYGTALKMFEDLIPAWAEAATEARLASDAIQHCERALLAFNARQ